MKDANLQQSTALKNGAGTVASTGFDLKHGAAGDFEADLQLEITIPAIPVANLPNGKTVTVGVYHATASNFSGEALLMGSVIVVTGATATDPSVAVTKRVRLPRSANRYIRVKATQNDSSADASDYSMVTALKF